MKFSKLAVRACATVAALAVAGQAQAVTFALTNTGGAEQGTQARRGFDIAAAYWSSVLTDNVTVNLNIGFQPLGPGVLGQTGSASTLFSAFQTYTAFYLDTSSRLDATAVTNLRPLGASALGPTFGAVAAIANGINAAGDAYVDKRTRLDNDGSVNNSAFALSQAEAKALGQTVDVNGDAIDYAATDGDITFSSDFGFDFDPTDGIDRGSFDFVGVAIHEIGHALGFSSGVDIYDLFTKPDGPLAGLGTLEDYVVASGLDLFRYGRPGRLDWSTQGNPYFSIDGGRSELFGDSRFATGAYNGDGDQASHWKDSARGVPQLGIMDPTADYGQTQQITALDLAAFDAIGYDIKFDVLANSGYRFSTVDAFNAFSGVPEAATWAQMILGFGVMGGAMRVRRRRATVRLGA